MDDCRCKEFFKELTHKFSFAATYPGCWQRQGQSGLGMPEEKLGIEALGGWENERVDSGIPILNHLSEGSSHHVQTDHSPESQQPEGKQ